MAVKMNDELNLDFLTISPTTHQPIDPDANHPVVNVYEGAATTPMLSFVYGTDGEVVRYETGYFKFNHTILSTDGYEVGKMYNISIHWEQTTQTRRNTLATFRLMSENYETTEGMNVVEIEGQDATDQLEDHLGGQTVEFDVRLDE